MMQKTISNTPILNYFIITILVFFTISDYAFSQGHNPQNTDQKFATALQIIRFSYVDTVNEEQLTESAINGMLKELDPHSVYMSKKEVDKANEPLQGNFEGIGVQFDIIKDTITVVTPVPGGPSEKLGIMSGDKIVTIDGEDATGKDINNEYVLKHLRGDKGTQVVVGICRKSIKGIQDYTIIRDKIPIFSMDAAYMAAPEVGYIKLNKFAATTMDEFLTAMAKLKEKGMKHLILDLQNNSGGYLNTAIDLADEFLGADKMIVYTEGYSSRKQENKSTSAGGFESGRLIVLVNEGSASASEIVAGAIQDWDRGIIIGRRTFGKGLVQRPYQLPDGSVIRLTTAHYYTPTGRCVQKPYDEGVEKYYEDFTKRFKHGELVNPDSIKFPDSLKYYTPNKRVVYGGGGIMPDIFIPMDTTRITGFYSAVIRKGILNEFVMTYLDTHRDGLKLMYPNIDEFNSKYEISDQFLNEFYEYSESQGVDKNKYINTISDSLLKIDISKSNPDVAYKLEIQGGDSVMTIQIKHPNSLIKQEDFDFSVTEKYLKHILKARLAQNLWDFGAFWQVYNEQDDAYLKALEIIQDKNKFKEYNVSY